MKTESLNETEALVTQAKTKVGVKKILRLSIRKCRGKPFRQKKISGLKDYVEELDHTNKEHERLKITQERTIQELWDTMTRSDL